MHHVLWAEQNGSVPKGRVVRHKCDNRRCINLAHLELGTWADNSNDMKVRGRQNTHRGETRSDAKLTLLQVHEIAASSEKQWIIADRYGIRQSTVSRIKAGKRWPERGLLGEVISKLDSKG